eukprot:1308211-Alexandrium_andersonii.AAC.1
MMWEEEYYEHASTAKGGKLSGPQMKAQWSEWERMRDENPDSVTWDKDGPKHAPMQFWVPLGKFLTFRDQTGER